MPVQGCCRQDKNYEIVLTSGNIEVCITPNETLPISHSTLAVLDPTNITLLSDSELKQMVMAFCDMLSKGSRKPGFFYVVPVSILLGFGSSLLDLTFIVKTLAFEPLGMNYASILPGTKPSQQHTLYE